LARALPLIAARHKKRTMFAKVNIKKAKDGSVPTLSRGDTETAGLIRHHLMAENQKAKEEAARHAKERQLAKIDEKRYSEDTSTAPDEEAHGFIEHDLDDRFYDPQATFLIINQWPYVLISHDSFLRGNWETMILGLVLFQAIQAPYEIAFDDSFAFTTYTWDIFMILLFFIDFGHNFFTTYCNKNGDLVINGQLIVQNYVHTVWFWVDLVSSIPYDLISSNDSASTSNIKTIKLLRLARMGKILKRVDSLTKAGGIRFLRLIVILLLFFHWTSCMWFAVGNLWFCRLKGFDLDYIEEDGTTPGFLLSTVGASDPDFLSTNTHSRQMQGLDVEAHICTKFVLNMREVGEISTLDVYIASIYQASTTLMGSGGAYTLGEQTLFAFTTVIGAILQATVFGSVAVLLASIDEDAVTFQKKMLKINHRMAYLDMPVFMQERVRSYYQKMWDTERSLTSDPDQFIKEVSKPLGADIKMRLYQTLLQKVTFLQNLNDIVVEELVKSLQTMLYLEGDLIMRKGESGNWMGLIGKGQVAILSPEDGKIIRIMEQGDYLGEMALLYRVNRTVDVRALTWVRMHSLSSEDLARIKEDYPEDIFALEEELEEMMVEKQYKHVEVDTSSDEESNEEDEEEYVNYAEGMAVKSIRSTRKLSKIGSNKSSGSSGRITSLASSNSLGDSSRSVASLKEGLKSAKHLKRLTQSPAANEMRFSSNKLFTGRKLSRVLTPDEASAIEAQALASGLSTLGTFDIAEEEVAK